ncbi:hypothetical protein SAMN02800692_1842 [Luteibacter sp. UNC138MFCol5.1]|uniref:hypothetical protein n=1 Tax=Luteibacter sp. UNC138MFCol5.1 TaxID=1502774 RepID=UPI0008CC1CA5|nr:hypothetical protein [Luteibacter sp. UNC138MFCol5.1]SEO74222.1 hypothetical protein SAMN02800692_1842 [Luteibacter sp. UNC138MFCol5.1]
MSKKFVTSLYGWNNDEAWRDVTDRALIRRRELLLADDPTADKLLAYGSDHRKDTALSANRILDPAGGVYLRPIDQHEDPTVWVVHHQVELGSLGLSPIFACGLAVKGDEGVREICERLPFESPDDAVTFFLDALSQPRARQIGHALGGSTAARAFGLAMLPESAEKITSRPNPTSGELLDLTVELSHAAGHLHDVLKKWHESDALRYLKDARHGETASKRTLAPRFPSDLALLLEGLRALDADLHQHPKRLGRRVAAGQDQLTATIIARFWKICGLGTLSLSQQSRFIRVCSAILPWHGIHKADVAQFMKAAMKKERRNGVVIG